MNKIIKITAIVLTAIVLVLVAIQAESNYDFTMLICILCGLIIGTIGNIETE